MALVLKDRVKETSTTSGTGTLTLGGAADGFQSFAAIGDGNTTYYAVFDPSTNDWEVGLGTYSSTGGTLTRDQVLESSNSGNLVDFSSASKIVFCTYPAEKSVTTDDIGTTIQAFDSTILKTADIGVSVQGFDATLLKSADIGVTVQGFDATILKSADIGVTVQGYDANTVKTDATQTLTNKTIDGDLNTLTNLSKVFNATVEGSSGTSDWTQASGTDPWIATIAVTGLLDTDVPIVDIDLSSVAFADVNAVQSDWALVYQVEVSDDDELTLYATDEPTENLELIIQVVR